MNHCSYFNNSPAIRSVPITNRVIIVQTRAALKFSRSIVILFSLHDARDITTEVSLLTDDTLIVDVRLNGRSA